MGTAAQNTESTQILRSAETRRVVSRRRLLHAFGMIGALCPLGGAYARWVEPFWLEVSQRRLPVNGLDPSLEGLRLAHLSDFHAGPHVPWELIDRAIDAANAARVDGVVLTGDLVNHDDRPVQALAERLARLSAPTFAVFGNHDYCVGLSKPFNNEQLAARLQQALVAAGVVVLRNASAPLARGAATLRLVGLEDLWTPRFRPDLAFGDVPGGASTLCLSHNPDSARLLTPFAPGAILAGHTHGGQVRLPLYGALYLRVDEKRLQAGLYEVDGVPLFVSKGVGYLMQMRFLCRPEITIHTLVRAA